MAGQRIAISKELPIGADLIARFPDSVGLIIEAGTGFNNIDVAAARERGIDVCNVPGYSTAAVAQLVITFVLALSSSLPAQQRMIERGRFGNHTEHLKLPHHEVQAKALGVVGAGAIGQEVIRLARALRMEVLAFDVEPRGFDDPGVRFVSLEELLRGSDFVTVHCPLTADTRHLIDLPKLALMKPSAFLINAARGPIVKEDDLLEALRDGSIAGAALDVQDPEPPETDNPLFGMDNVVLTPHMGWKPLEARQRLIDLICDEIEAFRDGRPVNLVN